MQVVRHYFGVAPPKDAVEPLWPAINDLRHGYVPGLHYLPAYAGTLLFFGEGALNTTSHRRHHHHNPPTPTTHAQT